MFASVSGEEFALILPGTDLRAAMRVADKIRAEIESNEIQVEGVVIAMTSSFAVAMISDKDTCLSDIIIRADRALYHSKRAGRNQVDIESSQLMLAVDGTIKPISR